MYKGAWPFSLIRHSCLSLETILVTGLKKSFEHVKDENSKIYLNHPESAKLAYVGMFILNLRCSGWCKFESNSAHEVTASRKVRVQLYPLENEALGTEGDGGGGGTLA